MGRKAITTLLSRSDSINVIDHLEDAYIALQKAERLIGKLPESVHDHAVNRRTTIQSLAGKVRNEKNTCIARLQKGEAKLERELQRQHRKAMKQEAKFAKIRRLRQEIAKLEKY